ncbi:MAG: glycosyltransferase family 2 protein [Deltaproteobacteria bacterium]|nr:glycosyltransferase family 2 protein [Deltaproteobacteria bacterium]
MEPGSLSVTGRAARVAFVVPVYNHAQTVSEVIRGLRPYGCPIVVVDDGSTDGTGRVLDAQPGIQLLRHPVNRGKGAALLTGMAAAAASADFAISIDADGQHDPADAGVFLEAADRGQRLIAIGCRRGMQGPHTPWTSRFGRGFSNFWVRAAGGPRTRDSQSGYRLYPLPEVLELGTHARRFQWEVEVLVKAHWKGLPVVDLPVGVAYQPRGQRISHFRPFVDFWRNAAAFSALFFMRLFVPSAIRARRRARAGLAEGGRDEAAGD